MKKINLGISFRDKRGDIIDLISKEKINAVTLITFKKGAVRGNHCHKRTTQWNYVLSGKIKLLAQMPGKNVAEIIAKKGDFVVTFPGEKHALIGMKTSELLVLTKGPRGGKEYENDTFRLKKPLKE
jgi:quercetin dioxygenase-like cupin family protein